MSLPQSGGVPETLEAAADKRKADTEYEAKGKKYEDPAVAEAERRSALAAMGLTPFVAPQKNTLVAANDNIANQSIQTDINDRYVPPVENEKPPSDMGIIPEDGNITPDTDRPTAGEEPSPVAKAEAEQGNTETKEIIPQIVMDAPMTPLIMRLGREGYIPTEITAQVAEGIANSDGSLEEVEKVLESFSEIPKELRSAIVSRLKDMNDPEKAKKYQQVFGKAYENELKVFQNDNGEFINTVTGKNAFEMVGAAYMTSGSENASEGGNREALDMAFETALNRALQKSGTLPVNETFERNKELVRNGNEGTADFNVRFTALMSILDALNTRVAKAFRGTKKGENQMNLRKSNTQEKKAKLAEFQEQLRAVEGDLKATNEIRRNMEALTTEEVQPSGGEVDGLGGGGVFETASSTTGTKEEKT